MKKTISELRKALIYDSDYFFTWQANIAMAFKDEMANYKKRNNKKYLCNIDIHYIANNAAKNFLDLLIEKES